MTTKAPPKGAFSPINVGGFSWEKDDCAVLALSVACGMPYPSAHALLKAHGRKDRDGTYGKTVSAALGLPYISARPLGSRLRPTYAQWLEAHREGTYVVFVTGHFFAVVDGVQHDSHQSLYRPRTRVYGYWRIK